jgi:hypothetical protein
MAERLAADATAYAVAVSTSRPRPPAPAPLEPDSVTVVAVGTGLWALAFLVMVPFAGRLADAGHGWWLWTALAGFGLGLLGVEYCRRRRDRLAASR